MSERHTETLMCQAASRTECDNDAHWISDPEADGVWMVGHFDWNWITESVHATEIEALRVINGRGYGEVYFLPFGVPASEASMVKPSATA